MTDIMQPRHTVTLSDVDLFLIRSGLDHLYDSWRKEQGDACEYLVKVRMTDTWERVPKPPAGADDAEKIYTILTKDEVVEKLREIKERDGELTPEAAAEAIRAWDEIGRMRW